MPGKFAKALHAAKASGWTPFVSMRNHLDLLNRAEEREMLPLCSDQGIAVCCGARCRVVG